MFPDTKYIPIKDADVVRETQLEATVACCVLRRMTVIGGGEQMLSRLFLVEVSRAAAL